MGGEPIESEFASVEISVDHDGHNARLRIVDVKTGQVGYLDALERASLRDDLLPFQVLMHDRLDTTLDEYLAALREGA